MNEERVKNKNFLRNQVIQERKKLDKKTINKSSNFIYKNFLKIFYRYKPASVFTYIQHGNEVKTEKIIEFLLGSDITVSIPKTDLHSKTISAVEIKNVNSLKPGNYGILEPDTDEVEIKVLEPETIDLILTPGIVFDKNGGRIGYGGGFYDKFFYSVSKDCFKIGLAYNFQLKNIIPQEIHDIRVDMIITEKGVFNCKKFYKKNM